MLEHSDKNVISLEMLYVPFQRAMVLLKGEANAYNTHIVMTIHNEGRHIFMFVMLCYDFIVTFSIFRIYLKTYTLNQGRKPGKLYNELTIEINFRENRRSNQEQTIQRNWQYSKYKTQDEDKQNKKHNTDSHNDEQNGPHQKTEGQTSCLRRTGSSLLLQDTITPNDQLITNKAHW